MDERTEIGFRAAKLFFGTLSLGDVAAYRKHALLIADRHRDRGELAEANFSGLRAKAKFLFVHFALAQYFLQSGAALLGVGPNIEFGGGFANDFFGGVTRHAAKTLVDFQVAPLRERPESDCVRTGLDHADVFLIGLAKVLFNALPSRNIAEDAGEDVLFAVNLLSDGDFERHFASSSMQTGDSRSRAKDMRFPRGEVPANRCRSEFLKAVGHENGDFAAD